MINENNTVIELSKYVTSESNEFISGHFPGRMLYQGVLVIELVDWALKEWLYGQTGEEHRLVEIPEANFHRTIEKGKQFTLEISDVYNENLVTIVDCKVVCNNEEAVNVKLKYLLFGDKYM